MRKWRVKFGLSYNTAVAGTDPANLKAIARHADDLGFESFYLPEHIALYPGARVGEMEFPPDLQIADPLECLAFVAASTTRILLGTGVLLLPYHQPVVLAKRLATIDVLSSGRMRLLTIGVSSLPGEAAAVGVDFATRGRRADEAIDILRALWAGDATGTSFHGQFYSFEHVTSYPKPLRILPIHIGGSSAAAARRAGRRGNGFFAGGWLPPAERLAQIELMRATALAEGRDPEALEYTRWGSIDLEPSGVEAYAAQGVDRLVVGTTSGDLDEQLRQLEAFATLHGLRR
ncbi:MAG TPA: TIGR03619 family F420-dependent LLM class oxidoreductase [Streptosporangiaceae bacterium]|nr:TIGR03619 family F420-dependent LLM class oxidoreductase [Streptosporangiaceae bacterium]